MKAESPKQVVDHSAFRKMLNKIITKNKGLSVVENAHGAIQVKRDGALLFSSRSDGVIITHPIKEGKERIFKHPGNKWDHLSRVPHDKVTEKMLTERVADPKTAADYHNEFYKKNPEASGLHMKAEAARNRIAKLKAEAEAEKGKKSKALKRVAKAEEKAVKREPKKSQKAIRKTAEEAA